MELKHKVVLVGTVVLIALVGLLVIYLGPQKEQGNNNNPEMNFRKSGYLVKDNPGFKANTWYLVYDMPGAPGLNVELIFDQDSYLFIDQKSQKYEEGLLTQGFHATLEGVKTNGTVRVKFLNEIEDVEAARRNILLYYYSPDQDRDSDGNILCSRKGLVAVDRQIPLTNTPIQDAVRLLLAGNLTDSEKTRGITTEYPLEGFSLKGADLKNGILTLEFTDQNNKTNGGACRVGILWFQIEATVKQFPEVEEVKFKPEELFQP